MGAGTESWATGECPEMGCRQPGDFTQSSVANETRSCFVRNARRARMGGSTP